MPVLSSTYHESLVKKLLHYSECRRLRYSARWNETDQVFLGKHDAMCFYFNKAQAQKLTKFVFCSQQTSAAFGKFFEGDLRVKLVSSFGLCSSKTQTEFPLVLESFNRLITYVEMNKRVFPYMTWLAAFCIYARVRVMTKLTLGFLKILSRRQGVEKPLLVGETSSLIKVATQLPQAIFFQEAKIFYGDLPAFLNTDTMTAKKLTLMIRKKTPLMNIESVNLVHKNTTALTFEYMDRHPLPDIPAFVAAFKKIFPRCQQFTFSIQSKGIFDSQEDKAMERVFEKLAALQEKVKKYENLKAPIKIVDEFPVSGETYKKLLKNGFQIVSYRQEIIVNRKQHITRNLSAVLQVCVGADRNSPIGHLTYSPARSASSSDVSDTDEDDDYHEYTDSSDAESEKFFYSVSSQNSGDERW